MPDNTSAVARISPSTLAIGERYGWDADYLAALKLQLARGCPDITDAELLLFGQVCKKRQLDPIAKEVYIIRRGRDLTIQTSIDGYRALAARTRALAGIDDAIYDKEYDGTPNTHPNTARVTVRRLVHGQRCAFTATARWDEYAVYENSGKPQNKWATMPWLMLAKCAESLALRKGFADALAGIYTDEEMGQADNQARIITVEAIPNQQQDQPATKPATPPKNQPQPVTTTDWLAQVTSTTDHTSAVNIATQYYNSAHLTPATRDADPTFVATAAHIATLPKLSAKAEVAATPPNGEHDPSPTGTDLLLSAINEAATRKDLIRIATANTKNKAWPGAPATRFQARMADKSFV